MRQKIKLKKKHIFFLAAAVYGVLSALLAKDPPQLQAFAGGFAHAFPAEFSLEALSDAVLWQFFPLLVLLFSSWTLVPAGVGAVIIGLRCAIDGYVLCGVFRAMSERDSGNVILWVIILLFEVLTLLCMNSMVYLAEMRLVAAKKEEKTRVLRYLRDQSFFMGLIFVFYLMRGTVMLLLTD